jgi:serine/threonine protein kinase
VERVSDRTEQVAVPSADDIFGSIAESGHALVSAIPAEKIMQSTENIFYSMASGLSSALSMTASLPSLSSVTGFEMINPIWREYELELVIEDSEFLSTMVIRKRDDPSDRKLLRRLNKSFLPNGELARVRSDTERFRQLIHQNLCSIFHTHETPNELLVVMEYCDMGCLYTYQQERTRLQEPEVARIVNQTSLTLDYLHRKDFLYRDVKPQNIFLSKRGDDFDIKLVWNPWIVFSQEPQTLQAGTLTFVSPEMSLEQAYSKPVDVWALGITMYILLSGVPPFLAKKRKDLYAKVQSGEYEFPEDPWEETSREAQVLIKQMLKVEPDARIRLDLISLSTFIIQHDPPLAG